MTTATPQLATSRHTPSDEIGQAIISTVWHQHDIRGIGGYVVAPPSQLGDFEHRYQWLIKPSPVIRK